MNRVGVLLGAAALGVGLLAGCGGDSAAPDAGPASAGVPASGFPRTVQVAGSPATEVTIPAEPGRIAALSPDVAEAAIELVGAQRVIAIPASAATAALSNYPEQAATVATKLPPGTDPDPEQVIALDPDLILVTTRHGGEQDAQAVLAQAGIPMIAIGNSWGTIDAIKQNLTTLGQALGAEAKASEVIAAIDQRVSDVAAKIGSVTARPSVAILSNQTSRPFLNASTVLTSELVKRAGGDLVADRIGLRTTGPVSAEQLVNADPDAILLVDVTGRGRDSFASILDNPAVADLAAVKNGKVEVVPARLCYAVGGGHVAEGLETIAQWLHADAFK